MLKLMLSRRCARWQILDGLTKLEESVKPANFCAAESNGGGSAGSPRSQRQAVALEVELEVDTFIRLVTETLIRVRLL